MKSFVVALCVFAVAAAVSDKDAQIISSVDEHQPDGSFNTGFQTDNGISSQQGGELKSNEKNELFLKLSGASEYTGPDGVVYKTVYVADENGFHPEGAHLPTPPAPVEIPAYIARAIEWAAAHPYKDLQ